jgi:hypothetical protein
VSAVPDELQAKIREAERELRRLERVHDPGAGRPRGEASVLRERQLRQLEAATNQLETLHAEWRETSPEEVRKRTIGDYLFRRARREAIAKATTDEDREFIATLHEGLQEREREREAARARERAEDLARHPGDPRADSIAAAVMSDPDVLGTVEIIRRPVLGEAGETFAHALDSSDLGVLATTLFLLSERRPVVFPDWGMTGRWPDREPPIVPVERLRESLLALRRVGLLALTAEGGEATADYGPWAKQIAAKWGIEIDGDD